MTDELRNWPLPWHVTRTSLKRRMGYNYDIRAANGNYIVEHVRSEALAHGIVCAMQENDRLRGDLAAVQEYASYYAAAWEVFEANSDGPEPLGFEAWLAAGKPEVER